MATSSYGNSYVASSTRDKDIIDLSSDKYNIPSYNVDYFSSVNGTLKNIHFKGKEGTRGVADGMYVFGDQVNSDNVHFYDVGDSAITSKEVNNVTTYNNEAGSTFVRVNLGKTYAESSISIANSNINNVKCVIDMNENGQGARITNSENGNNINGNIWKMIYIQTPLLLSHHF